MDWGKIAILVKNVSLKPCSLKNATRSSCSNISNGPVKLSYVSHQEGDPVKLSYVSHQESDILGEQDSPVIVLHGLFGWKRNFYTVAKNLSKTNRTVIVPDCRNHGDSPRVDVMDYFNMSSDVQQLLNDLDLPKAVIMGHSLGGKTAMVLALTKPELVERLIVVDVSPVPTPSSGFMVDLITAIHQTEIRNDLPLSKVRKAMQERLEPIVPSLQTRQLITTNLVEEGETIRWRVNIDALEKNISSLLDFPAMFTQYKGPTLFLGGELSPYISDREQQKIKRLFPNSETQHIPGAGHFVHADKPNEFVELVTSFLDKTRQTS